jgi:hypothetical protein
MIENNIRIITRNNKKLRFEIKDMLYHPKFKNVFESEEARNERTKNLIIVCDKLEDDNYELSEKESKFIKSTKEFLGFVDESYGEPVKKVTINGEDAFI